VFKISIVRLQINIELKSAIKLTWILYQKSAGTFLPHAEYLIQLHTCIRILQL